LTLSGLELVLSQRGHACDAILAGNHPTRTLLPEGVVHAVREFLMEVNDMKIRLMMAMRPLLRALAVVVLAGTWHFGVVAAAHAQAQPPAAGDSVVVPQAPNIPDHKLDAMAAALERVTSVRQNYETQISQAHPSEKERLADEGNNAIEKAVTDQGLSVEEFNTIIVVAQNNPDVREKIIQRMRAPSGR